MVIKIYLLFGSYINTIHIESNEPLSMNFCESSRKLTGTIPFWSRNTILVIEIGNLERFFPRWGRFVTLFNCLLFSIGVIEIYPSFIACNHTMKEVLGAYHKCIHSQEKLRVRMCKWTSITAQQLQRNQSKF